MRAKMITVALDVCVILRFKVTQLA